MEADIAPGSNDPDVADRIDGALGEDSGFQQVHGFYVHGLTIDAASLPKGWEKRVVVLQNEATRGNAAWRRTIWRPASSRRSARRIAITCGRFWRKG